MSDPETRQDRLPWEEGSSAGRQGYTSLQITLLLRLDALLQKRGRYVRRVSSGRWQGTFDKAIYAAYRDCVDEGVEKEAKVLRRRWQQNKVPVAEVQSSGEETQPRPPGARPGQRKKPREGEASEQRRKDSPEG